jgi:CheY-like chemotaxis protein
MPGSPPLILLVEDEPEISTVISDILDDAGFRIEAASNYAEGVELLSASQPALLIADVLLPGGGDGYELAEAARPAALACQRCWSAGILRRSWRRRHAATRFSQNPSSCPNCNG